MLCNRLVTDITGCLMALYKRNKIYWYEFKYKGKRYRGSTAETDKEKAESKENNIKDEIKSLTISTDHLPQKQQLAHIKQFERKITKEDIIPLNDSWPLYEMSIDLEDITERRLAQNKSYWLDFIAFVRSTKPEIKALNKITIIEIRAYRDQLRSVGKFDHKGTRKRLPVSDRTVKEYLSLLKTIFKVLSKESQLFENPVQGIKTNTKKAKASKQSSRDILDQRQQAKILAFIKSGQFLPNTDKPEQFNLIIKALYLIGINTGLRRYDIAHLKWEHVDLDKKFIAMKTNKEGVHVQIPIVDPLLLNFLEDQTGKDSIYVVSELAKMYDTNPSGISERFQKLLRYLEIGYKKITTNHEQIKLIKEAIHLQEQGAINKKDAAKMCNVKYTTFLGYYDKLPPLRYEHKRTKKLDIHSLRHSLAYGLMKDGVEMNVIRLILGHIKEEMSELYASHSTEYDKEEAMRRYRGLRGGLNARF